MKNPALRFRNKTICIALAVALTGCATVSPMLKPKVAVPGGWEWLLEEVWPVLMARTPRGYELVVRRGEATPARERPLKRVA